MKTRQQESVCKTFHSEIRKIIILHLQLAENVGTAES